MGREEGVVFNRTRLAALGLVVAVVVGAGFALVDLSDQDQAAAPAGVVDTQAYGIDYDFYDFFNVPFREFWDLRLGAGYGDLPMNAECFSAEGIAEGKCTPSNPAVPDVASYPYAHWYPFAGSTSPASTKTVPFIMAPYRMSAVGTQVPGYTLSDPVYLPILNSGAAAGSQLTLDWRMDYVTLAQGTALKNIAGCSFSATANDGYYARSLITITMDLQESKRLFGVVGTDQASAQAWWNSNTNPACGTTGAVETSWQNAIVTLAGAQNTAGKFDIANEYEYYYAPFYTNITATVGAGGVTTVHIDHLADGTEAFLARTFYWGNAGYLGHTLDSRTRTGWWGMEFPWFEEFHFTTTIGANTHDFSLVTDVFYQFQELSDPGPNQLYDKTDDIPYWSWAAWLGDYVVYSAHHPQSELNRYPNPPYAYVHSTAGGFNYGTSGSYDNLPTTWDLKAGESMTFTFPTGNVKFYDPNLTPAGADPRLGQFVVYEKPLYLFRTNPASYGSWNEATNTLTITGPTTTGGPSGNAGPDGVPGTADDQYPTVGFPTIDLQPGPAYLRVTTSVDIHPTWGVWTQVSVDGVPRDEWGLAWLKVTPGVHTISWSASPGLKTPAPEIVTVLPGQTAVVNGEFKARGFLRVTQGASPVAGTVYVNDVPMDDWGTWLAVDPGNYKISWGPVAGFNPPETSYADVVAEQLTTVVGNYVSNPLAPGPDPATYGLLRVTTSIDIHPTWGVWSQVLVDGIPRDEWGLAWLKIAPGSHTISWTDSPGLATPAPQIVNVVAGETTNVDGQFVQLGFLRVTQGGGAVSGTMFVNGIPRDDWGMWLAVAPGTYEVRFGFVPGYGTPEPQMAVVTAGALTTITGNWVPA